MNAYKLIYRGPIKKIIDKYGLKSILEQTYWRISLFLNDTIQVNVGGYSYSVTAENWKEKAQFTTQGGERPVIESFLSEIGHNDIIWDIGANIGLYSIPADSIAETVVAFEPVPYNANRLINHAPNIEIKKVALSDNSGETDVKQEKNISLGWSTKKNSGGTITRKIVVPTEVDAPKPTVIKMDIEGGEWDVLRSMEDWLLQRDIRLIYVEVHPHHLPSEANIKEYLESFGYICEISYERDENYFIIGRSSVEN